MQAEERTTQPRPPAAPDARSNGQPGGDAHGREHEIPTDLPEVSGAAAAMIGVALVVLFGAMFLLGWIPHHRRLAAAKSEATEAVETKPVVDVTKPKRSDPTIDLLLPADVQAFQATALYARTNGYLKSLQPGIDIGAEVKAGQLLAEIAAPEVDAQLDEAKAALQQANVTVGRANNEYNFAKGTLDRYAGLSQTGGITQQQLDEKRSAFNISNSSLKAAQANVAAAEASVRRLTELQGFQKVVAPFDGVITARNYDAGALISTTNTGPGKELFQLAQTNQLRVFVKVPQTYATEVKPGQDAELLVRSFAGKSFVGNVARSANAIDPMTRTLRVEVDIPNAEGKLFPGMWGQVKFKIHQDKPPVVVPTSALVFGTDGMKVALLTDGNKVKYQPVSVGRDFGSEAEVATGLTGDEQVITNPGERLADGVEVKVISPQERAAAGQGGPGAGNAPVGAQQPPSSQPAAK